MCVLVCIFFWKSHLTLYKKYRSSWHCLHFLLIIPGIGAFTPADMWQNWNTHFKSKKYPENHSKWESNTWWYSLLQGQTWVALLQLPVCCKNRIWMHRAKEINQWLHIHPRYVSCVTPSNINKSLHAGRKTCRVILIHTRGWLQRQKHLLNHMGGHTHRCARTHEGVTTIIVA